MKRGEVWIAADRSGDYAGKPRPWLVVRSDVFSTFEGVTAVPLSSDVETAAISPVVRVPIAAHPERLPLARPSVAMADKVSTLRPERFRERVGTVSRAEMATVGRALGSYLGLG